MTDESIAAAAGPEAAAQWRSRYLVERRRARVFMATTGLAAAALVATVAYAATQPPAQPAAAPPQVEGVAPGTGDGPRGGFLARGGVERFFADDGSLDDEAVQRSLDRMESRGGAPDGFAARIAGAVDAAVADGTISADQGQALLSALGIGGTGDA